MGIIDKIFHDRNRKRKTAISNPPGWLRANAEVEKYKDINLAIPASQEELYARL